MNWKNFITHLLTEFKSSSYDLQKNHNISSSVITNILNGSSKKLNNATIEKLEKAFNIIIDHSDPQNIIYKKIDDGSGAQNIYEYPVINYSNFGMVKEDILNYSNERMYIPHTKREGCYVTKIFSDSMLPNIRNNDYALVDSDRSIEDNSIVLIRVINQEILLARCNDLKEDTYLLTFDNTNYKPRMLKKTDIHTIARIVKIIRDL